MEGSDGGKRGKPNNRILGEFTNNHVLVYFSLSQNFFNCSQQVGFRFIKNNALQKI